jgi:hypothetical protein
MFRLKNAIHSFALLGLLLFITFSCDDSPEQKEGKLTLSFISAPSSSARKAGNEAKKLLVSISDATGKVIETKKELSLYNFQGEFLSEPLSLTTGSYRLTEFIVLNADDEVVYVTPLEGSALAYLVNDPLPITFDIVENEVTKVAPEVIEASGHTADEFGYATFSFDVVETISFLLGVFVYDDASQSLKLTSGTLQIKSGTTILFTGEMGSVTNRVIIKKVLSPYTITLTKYGYNTYSKTFSTSELSAFESTPLAIVLINGNLSNGLVAYYPFNGNAQDNSGNNLNGIVNGATLTTDRHGNENSAYYFDGNDYISVAHSELINFGNNDDFTIALWTWINPTQVLDAGINDIIRKWNGDAQGYPFGISYDNENAPVGFQRTLLGARYDGSACYNIPTGYSNAVNSSVFHHVVFTKQGAVLRLYLNNELVSTFTDVSTCSTKNNSHMTIGCRGQLARFFTGKIDEIRIYNRALTNSEIAELGSI